MKLYDMVYDICSECEGVGETFKIPEGKKYRMHLKCSFCGGKGKVLSSFGKELLEFIKETQPWEGTGLTDKIDDLQNAVNWRQNH